MKSIFIFRRDFRIDDNNGLIECCKKSEEIYPIFIFTPNQIEENEYFSSNSFQFLLESLDELDKDLKERFKSNIQYFYGNNIDILEKFIKKLDFDSIFFNKDFTRYAVKRDKEIIDFCEKYSKKCFLIEDYLLSPLGTYLKQDGTPYEVYGPFKKNAITIKVSKPNGYKFKDKESNFMKIKSDMNLKDLDDKYIYNPDNLVKGGRINGLKFLKNIKKYVNYRDERNNLMTPTTHLSAYIKYGCISIREVYEKIHELFGINHGLIEQLLWREFYYYLGYYIPRVLEGKSLKEKYDKIIWENNPKLIEAWKLGLTGFPAVDAGMREMNKTGFMHNRGRLITSGILIKILNVDWRIGEKYFAQTLIDYDPIVNNGNWQWSSGSGADSQPYFRIMSPWKQAIDHDPDCEYIKKWIPELANVPNKDIFKWSDTHNKYKNTGYPKPIVDYTKMRKEIVEVYKKGLYGEN
jgi:deoxyribodipyrimidine photo-lyase